MLGSRISRIRLLLLNSAELQWGIVCEPIDLELSIKEDVFIVLLQFYLKHVFVLVTLLLSLIVVVLNFVLLNSLNCIQRKRRYRSIQVANWLILVFIVAERSWRELKPAWNEILLDTRLELVHFSFNNNFFLWIDNYLVCLWGGNFGWSFSFFVFFDIFTLFLNWMDIIRDASSWNRLDRLWNGLLNLYISALRFSFHWL